MSSGPILAESFTPLYTLSRAHVSFAWILSASAASNFNGGSLILASFGSADYESQTVTSNGTWSSIMTIPSGQGVRALAAVIEVVIEQLLCWRCFSSTCFARCVGSMT